MVEAQPVRLDEELPIGEVVRGPVVEEPVPDAGHVTTDREQVEGSHTTPRRTMPPSRNRNARDIGWQYHAAMTPAPGRHSPLDGLRAVAAVSVLLTHAAIYSGLATAGGDTARYAQRLEVGVAVFFVISGFVLYRPFVAARLDGRPLPLVGRFAGRRALRIVPAYWLALTVSALVLGLAGVFSVERLLHLLRVRPDLLAEHAHRRARAGLDAVRRGHVLRLPAALGLGMRVRAPTERDAILRREAIALGALFVASLGWKAAFAWSGSPGNVVGSPWLHSLPAYLDQFALGMGLAVLTLWRPPSAKLVPAAGILLAVPRLLGRERADRDRPPALRAVHPLAVPRPPPALRGGGDRARGGGGEREPRARRRPRARQQGRCASSARSRSASTSGT